MSWHESKFWRSVAVGGLVLTSAFIIKIGRAQDHSSLTASETPSNAPNVPPAPMVSQGLGNALVATPAAVITNANIPSHRSYAAAGSRLEELEHAGFIPWDTNRGIFLTRSDAGDRIVAWNFGTDWETKLDFSVTSSKTFTAGQ